jgi:hypothetical protein
MTEPSTWNRANRALVRVKLNEPARLYFITAGFVLVLIFTLAGLPLWTLPVVAVIVGAAGEAVRASVYSEAGHFRSLHAAASRWADITRRERV